MAYALNKLFDTSKPILVELADYAQAHKGFIPDPIFSQACREFGTDEDDVMEQMIGNPPARISFNRLSDGFTVVDNRD